MSPLFAPVTFGGQQRQYLCLCSVRSRQAVNRGNTRGCGALQVLQSRTGHLLISSRSFHRQNVSTRHWSCLLFKTSWSPSLFQIFLFFFFFFILTLFDVSGDQEDLAIGWEACIAHRGATRLGLSFGADPGVIFALSLFFFHCVRCLMQCHEEEMFSSFV